MRRTGGSQGLPLTGLGLEPETFGFVADPKVMGFRVDPDLSWGRLLLTLHYIDMAGGGVIAITISMAPSIAIAAAASSVPPLVMDRVRS